MGNLLGILGGTVGVIFFLIIGILQIYVGFLGVEYHLGGGWAVGVIILSFFFQIMLPLTIGTFFGALDVWGWPWYGALLFAAPGLLFTLPGAVGLALVGVVNLFKGKSTDNYQYSDSYRSAEPINVTDTVKKRKKTKKVKKRKKSR